MYLASNSLSGSTCSLFNKSSIKKSLRSEKDTLSSIMSLKLGKVLIGILLLEIFWIILFFLNLFKEGIAIRINFISSFSLIFSKLLDHKFFDQVNFVYAN